MAWLLSAARLSQKLCDLAQIGGREWVIAGCLNGDEVSTKLNREMALLVGSDETYTYLVDVFRYDRDVTP